MAFHTRKKLFRRLKYNRRRKLRLTPFCDEHKIKLLNVKTMAYKILLAEDDIQLVEMYKRKFQLEGFDVQTAEDGQQALDILETFTPDIAILDIMMPKVTGLEVLKSIRENPAKKDMLVMMLTNLGNETTSEEIYKLGATEYIVKADMTPLEVTNKVKAILETYKK